MRVSIIIPTYNCDKYIGDSIQSVINQTYDQYELIVIDDGSLDNTKKVVESFGNSIRYYFKENGGVSSARNHGIDKSVGEYVAFLDADDYYENEFLEKMVKKIEFGKFDWVVCDNYREFKSSENELIDKTIITRDISEKWDRDRLLIEFLAEDHVGSPNKILVKRDLLLKHKIRFDQALNSREDWDFCVQLIYHGLTVGWLREPLVTYRVWDDSTNSTRKMGHKWLDYTKEFLKKHTDLFLHVGRKNVLSDHYYALARHYWYIRNFKNAIDCLRRSIRFGGFKNIITTIMNKIKK